MGNTVGIEVSPSSIDDLLSKSMVGACSPSNHSENTNLFQRFVAFVRVWKFAPDSKDSLFISSSAIAVGNAFRFDDHSTYVILYSHEYPLVLSKSKAKTLLPARERIDSDTQLSELLSSVSSNLTPRGQQMPFGGSSVAKSTSSSLNMISTQHELYVWNGKKSSQITHAVALAKVLELDLLIRNGMRGEASKTFLFPVGDIQPISDVFFDDISNHITSFFDSFSQTNTLITKTMQSAYKLERAASRNSASPPRLKVSPSRHSSPPAPNASASASASLASLSSSLPSSPAPPTLSSSSSPSLHSSSRETSRDRSSIKKEARKSRSREKKKDSGVDPEKKPSKEREKNKEKSKDKDKEKKKKYSVGEPKCVKMEIKEPLEPIKRRKVPLDLKSLSLPSRSIQEASSIQKLPTLPTTKFPTKLITSEINTKQALGLGNPEAPPPAAKSKLNFYDPICSRITENLFLGSETIAKDSLELRRNSITHILNCAGTICPNYHPKEFSYKTLYLTDGKTEDITCLFYDVLEWMEEAYKDPRSKVFVHCQQGVSRSSSFLILYLMWKDNKAFQETHEFVKSIRETSNPNAGFMCQLLEWWKRHSLGLSSNKLYQIRPHGPGSPDTIVLKEIVPKSGPPSTVASSQLDQRWCFILNTQTTLFLWKGTQCSQYLLDWGVKYCKRIQHFEKEDLPIIHLSQGQETDDFWMGLASWFANSSDPVSLSSSSSALLPSLIQENKSFEISPLQEYDEYFALLKISDRSPHS